MIIAGWKVSNKKPNVDVPVKDVAGVCSADRLVKIILKIAFQSEGKAIIVLQYSDCGYANGGVPIWLLQVLKEVCGNRCIPLYIMFHELYATGNPWANTFWLSPL